MADPNKTQGVSSVVGSATVRCQLDCLSDGSLGLGVYTDGLHLTEEGAKVLAQLMGIIQMFCDDNDFPVNVFRDAQ